MNLKSELIQKREHTHTKAEAPRQIWPKYLSSWECGINSDMVWNEILTHFCLDYKGAGGLQWTWGPQGLQSQNKPAIQPALQHGSPSRTHPTPSLAPFLPPSSLPSSHFAGPFRPQECHALGNLISVKHAKSLASFSDRLEFGSRVWMSEVRWDLCGAGQPTAHPRGWSCLWNRIGF